MNKGTCKFSEKCWFNHSERETLKGTETEDHANENNDTEIKETKEVIQKLFKMMENFTDKLKQMKEINQLKWSMKKWKDVKIMMKMGTK